MTRALPPWLAFCAAAVSNALAGGCEAPAPEPGEAPPLLELAFVADANLSPGTEFEGFEEGLFGGLSAVVYEQSRGWWFTLSDARARSHFFRLGLELVGGDLRVEPLEVVFLTDEQGESFPSNVLDPEGLARTPWETWLVSTEPDLRDDPTEPAKLLEFDDRGRLLRPIDVPEKFRDRDWPPSRGVRHNLGFEALSFSPDDSSLFVGVEATLLQDGPPAGFQSPGFSRIVRYDVDVPGRALTPAAEYVYSLGPFARIPDFESSVVSGGLVELVALSGLRLLALERVFIQEIEGAGRNVTLARIYAVDLSRASDVSGMASLGERLDWRPAQKELVLDLDDVLGRLSPGFTDLDNMEGMGLGPELPEGGRALLLVSDDNFRAAQRTQFVLLRLKGL